MVIPRIGIVGMSQDMNWTDVSGRLEFSGKRLGRFDSDVPTLRARVSQCLVLSGSMALSRPYFFENCHERMGDMMGTHWNWDEWELNSGSTLVQLFKMTMFDMIFSRWLPYQTRRFRRPLWVGASGPSCIVNGGLITMRVGSPQIDEQVCR